jgi:hypothetical protein
MRAYGRMLSFSVNVVVEHPGLVLEQLAAVHLYRS